eukprot:3851698-Amphidinium_carterae.1
MFPAAAVEALDFTRLCLQFSPAKRMSAKALPLHKSPLAPAKPTTDDRMHFGIPMWFSFTTQMMSQIVRRPYASRLMTT